jgi:hypothetical protein
MGFCARMIAFSAAALFLSSAWTRCACAQSEPPGAPKQDQIPQLAAKADSSALKPPLEDSLINPNPLERKDPPKRMFGMIPDFESANDTPANQKPLTAEEKYILSLHQAFDFSAHIGDAFQSGIQQMMNGQPHFGQGWGAYGERFAASEADQVTGSVLIYGFLPSVLHEDPRYFRQGKGSARSRVWYAVNRTFVTRRDDGANEFNISETVGQLASCGISTTYYPARDRSVGGVFLNWAVNLGYNSGYNVLTEYYTDILKAVLHRHANAGASASADTMVLTTP